MEILCHVMLSYSMGGGGGVEYTVVLITLLYLPVIYLCIFAMQWEELKANSRK